MSTASDRSNIRDDLVHLFIATPQGQSITVGDVDLSIDDVSRLQQAWESSPFSISAPPVFDEAGHHNVRLVFAGKDLEVGQPLERYGLVRGSTVQVLGRLKGGAQLGKAVKGRSQVKKKGADKPKEHSDLQAKYAKMQEMEAHRQQAMAAKAELRRRVEQEGKNSKMNRLKIQNQWRKIMRLSKVESLRKDIEILSQNHERDVDRKDAIIQMLDRDLEEAEDQFQSALKTHLQNTDQLIDLQDSRLLTLEQEFEVELKALQEDFAEERKQIVAEHAAQVQELNDIIAAVEAQEAEKEDEAKQDHEQHREEIRNKNLEEINVLRIMLDSQIEELEQIFEAAHINYLENTDQRTTDFKYLTSKDQQLSRDIEVKIRKIERLQSGLQHWRTKIAQNVKENAERNSFLTEERNAIQGHFHQLKGRMNKFRAAQAKRLGELAQNANAVKKRLKEQVDLANKILTLAELARKAETEKEKVLPFYVSGYSDEVEEEVERTERKPKEAREAEISPLNPLQSWALGKHEQPVLGLNRLDNFHKRYNKALLEKLAIEREQRRLEAENRDLKGIVKQYLDGISVPEDAVGSDANTLLVVNGRVNLSKQDTDSERSGIVAATIDGNHMVSTGRVNTRTGL